MRGHIGWIEAIHLMTSQFPPAGSKLVQLSCFISWRCLGHYHVCAGPLYQLRDEEAARLPDTSAPANKRMSIRQHLRHLQVFARLCLADDQSFRVRLLQEVSGTFQLLLASPAGCPVGDIYFFVFFGLASSFGIILKLQ